MRAEKHQAEPGKKLLEYLRLELAKEALLNSLDYMERRKGPVAYGKHLAGVAKTWGVKLPSDWDARAKELMPKDPDPQAKKGKK